MQALKIQDDVLHGGVFFLWGAMGSDQKRAAGMAGGQNEAKSKCGGFLLDEWDGKAQ